MLLLFIFYTITSKLVLRHGREYTKFRSSRSNCDACSALNLFQVCEYLIHSQIHRSGWCLGWVCMEYERIIRHFVDYTVCVQAFLPSVKLYISGQMVNNDQYWFSRETSLEPGRYRSNLPEVSFSEKFPSPSNVILYDWGRWFSFVAPDDLWLYGLLANWLVNRRAKLRTPCSGDEIRVRL